MSKQITALEIHYLLKEFKDLLNSRIDRIYQPEKNLVTLQFYISGKGKRLLTIHLPKCIYLSDARKESPEKPFNFCMILRKYLDNARLRDIKQREFERVIEFEFEKDKKYYLFVELFSDGNIILCDDKSNIINCLEAQAWRERTIKKGIGYNYPKKIYNFIEIKDEELKELVHNSKRDSIVKALAVELGLGGVYSEEACLLANISKNKKELDDEEFKRLTDAFNKIKNSAVCPVIIYDDKENILDVVPFTLMLYDGYKKKEFETFSSALESYFAQTDKTKGPYEDEILKLKGILRKQDEKLSELKNEEDEYRKKGELIYNNYQLINDILVELKKAREKYSWKEIREKLKGHKIIKEIDEKNNGIIIDI